MSENNKNGGFNLDPDVKEELEETKSEEDIIGMYQTEGGDSEKVPVLKSWLPDSDEWQAKTVVNEREARLMAVARNLTEAYDEIEHMEPFIEGLITDLEMYKTSVDGMAREQQKSVLMAMFGRSSDAQESQSMVMSMLAGQQDDD